MMLHEKFRVGCGRNKLRDERIVSSAVILIEEKKYLANYQVR